MAFTTSLIYNISTGRLILSVAQPSPIDNPSWFYLDTKHLAIQFVQNGATNGTVSVVPANGIGLTIGIGTPGQSPITSAPSATADSTNTFTIDLPMGTADILSALGSPQKQFTSTLELRTSDGTNYQRYEIPITIKPSLLTGTISATPPPDVAIGSNAVDATYMRKSGRKGDFFTLTSDDGTTSCKVYWGNDSQIHFERLT